MVCGFVPDEGFWVSIVVLDEAADGVFQFLGGAVDAAPKLLFCQCCKPAFDQVEP